MLRIRACEEAVRNVRNHIARTAPMIEAVVEFDPVIAASIQIIDRREAVQRVRGCIVRIKLSARREIQSELIERQEFSVSSVRFVNVEKELSVLDAVDCLDRHIGQLDVVREVERIFLILLERACACVVALLLPVVLQSKKGVDVARSGRLRGHFLKNCVVDAWPAASAVCRQIAGGRRRRCNRPN